MSKLPSPYEEMDDFAKKKKEFRMIELNEVFVFCALYSSVVIFALWMTVTESVGAQGELSNEIKS